MIGGNMNADHRLKQVLFRSYAFISASVFIVAMLASVHGDLTWNTFATIAAGAFAFAFGVQKQNLEETRLFKELFERFNERYDALNDDLNRICKQSSELPLNEKEMEILFKYFNLCGEEYLYFAKGFICAEAWNAWRNGMKYLHEHPRIKDLWDKELAGGSYYGLRF
jgi:hypothetical protein